jgi:ribonuclease R
MQALTDFLQTLDIPWSKGEAPNTHRFNKLLDDTREGPHADIVNEVVLRSQMQAQYNAENIGHFGLNLAKYAHFTSPIRRYADLIVHRGLIRARGLGSDGLTDEDIKQIKDTAERITHAERRAMAAERDATDRYVAAFLADKVGAEFEGRITGVTRFGLFVRLVDTGADGLIPVSSLGDEFFVHDDRSHALVGERSGARWPLGMAVQVRLREATPVTGGLLFEMLSEPARADPNAPRPRLGVRRRGDFGKDPGRGGPKRGGVPKGVRKGKRR